MIETTTYVRKPFHIQAVRVTAENMADVASWCQGEIRTADTGTDAVGAPYIKVRVHRPANDRQTTAFVGDWVLYAGTGFKVYINKAFTKAFDQVSVESTMQQTASDVAAETPVVAVVTMPNTITPADVQAASAGPVGLVQS